MGIKNAGIMKNSNMRTKTTARKTVRKAAAGKRAAQKSAPGKKARKWSARVNQTSDALDLESRIFRSKDPRKIARSLKHSAEKSRRRKGTPLQSAMSMLNFYINRAGKNLTAAQKQPLQKAKQ